MNIQCIDIGGTSIKSGLFKDGVLVSHSETPTLAQEGAQALLARVCTLIPPDADAVGVSTAGQVDAATGRILFATDALPGWTGMPLGEELARRFPVPVAVENDVNAAALGEAHHGAGQGYDNLLCIAYGTGIGGGVLLGGALYRGATGSAGEFGHIPLMHGGRRCACGGRGCYETYASMRALARTAARTLKAPFDAQAFFAAAACPDTPAHAVLARWTAHVAAGLRGLIYAFNPAAVILGGGVMERPAVTQAVAAAVMDTLMPSYRAVRILPAALGNHAALYGAHHLAAKAAQNV